ncbi:MAG TPA: class I SAM-dependent methyltransferase [Terricaulis sp.]|nr:class I SAM-dependent methyltransferase [Terricaulis sp.]
MSSSIGLSPELIRYLADANPPEHPVLARCRVETQAMPQAQMQISPEQGAFMQAIVRMIAARRAFEVGVFTGYSALAVALAMKERGAGARLLACDVDADVTAKAQAYWREAGVDGIIDLTLQPAIETLDQRLAAREAGAYDFGFIDADKTGYDGYYERGLKLLRSGGVMLFDNMLWGGQVVDATDKTPDTIAIRALAAKAKTDERVHAAMTAVGDGVLIVVKR